MLENKVVAVTGAAGFVGYATVNKLLNLGATVRAADIREPEWFHRYEKLHPDRFSFTRYDVTQPQQGVFEGAEDLIHTAAVLDHAADERVHQTVNVIGTDNVFSQAVAEGVTSFVHIGSSTIYGIDNQLGEDGYSIDETTTPDPRDSYARSKLAGRLAAAQYNKAGERRVFIIDPPGVFGAHNDYGVIAGSGPVIKAVLKGMFFTPRNYKFSNVHAQDIANFASYLLDSDLQPQGNRAQDLSYLVATEDAVTVRDLYEIIWEEVPEQKRAKVRKWLTKRIPPPRWAAMAVSYIGQFLLGRKNSVHPEMMKYAFSHHAVKTQKMQGTGFKPGYPTNKDMIRAVMQWHKTSPKGLIKIKEKEGKLIDVS